MTTAFRANCLGLFDTTVQAPEFCGPLRGGLGVSHSQFAAQIDADEGGGQHRAYDIH